MAASWLPRTDAISNSFFFLLILIYDLMVQFMDLFWIALIEVIENEMSFTMLVGIHW